MEIEISKVQIGDSRRAIDSAMVDKLAESMKQVGLLNPISIDYGYHLIAGAHRIAAAKKLGWELIPCNMLDIEELQAKLAELDENLVRNQGSLIEQGEWLAEKKRIYERLHPETKANVAGGIAKQKTASDKLSLAETPSFVADTAEKTGLSKRTIERSIQIAESLTPETKEFAKEVEISKTNALNLARKTPEEQRKIVEPIKSFIQTVAPEERKETAHRLLGKELAPKSIAQIEYEGAVRNTYASAIKKVAHLEMKPDNIRLFYEFEERCNHVEMYLTMIERGIKYLNELKEYFLNPVKVGGMKS